MKTNSKGITKIVFGLVVFALVAFFSCSSEINYTPPVDSDEVAITHYSLGKIVVDGRTYAHNVAIFPDKSVRSWRINANHLIQLEDIKTGIELGTQALIIGLGAERNCPVAEDVIKFARKKDIEFYFVNTFLAVKLFNIKSKKGLCAYFHLN